MGELRDNVMTNTGEVKLLLREVALIRRKHTDVLRAARYQFNIFSMLRQPQEEVHLHSRFLGELLDPRGDHCQGDAFLRLFLEQVETDGFPSEDAEVNREYHNIDIFIRSNDHAIIIENKIYAGDQDRQLERYYRAASSMGSGQIAIVYLTLKGHEPSKQSLGKLVDRADEVVHCISYEEDIHAWLDACIDRAARYPVVRETIVQYQRLIEVLTGHSLSRGYTMELRDLLIDEENIALAADISQALVKAKIEIQFKFWQELERRLREEGFTVTDGGPAYPKYSRRRVQRYYERSRRKRYGIALSLDELNDGVELLFFAQVRKGLYYSFLVVRDGERKIAEEAQFDHLADICKQVDGSFERSSMSLGWKNPSRLMRFRDFNDSDTFAMANPAKRREYIDERVAEIQRLIRIFEALRDNWSPDTERTQSVIEI